MRCFCLTNQISLHRHIKQADWTHHSQLLDILWFILETNQFIRKNNWQIDRKWNSSIREWVYCESSSYFQPEETTAVQGKMQIGWNTDCLMAGLVVYFTSLSDVTVCGSNKNTETVSLTANNDLHVLPWQQWEVLLPSTPGLCSNCRNNHFIICFNPFASLKVFLPFHLDNLHVFLSHTHMQFNYAWPNPWCVN